MDLDDSKIAWWIVGGILTILSIVVISVITQRAISKETRKYEQQCQQDENIKELGEFVNNTTLNEVNNDESDSIINNVLSV